MPQLIEETPSHPLPADLAAFLLCHLAVSVRDEDVLREALRETALSLPDREAHKVALSLHKYISPAGQTFLKRLA